MQTRRRARLATFDRRPGEAPSYIRARKEERWYGAQLRKIARHVGEMVNATTPTTVLQADLLAAHLRRYAEAITPWARSVATRMLADIARRDERTWRARAVEMGRLLHREIEGAPVGNRMKALVEEQAVLITSLPLEAGQRVQRLAVEGLSSGARAKELAAEIMRTGEVTQNRANTIARTETSKAATSLVRARAEHVGSTHFIWRTSEDSDVRPTHRALNGKTFAWDSPPECDPGHRALPGQIWNCRCYAEPVIPDLE